MQTSSKQFISSWPLIGKEAITFYDALTSNRFKSTQYSAIVAPFDRIARAAKLWNKDDDDDIYKEWKAAGLVLEAASLWGLPYPSTAINRLIRSGAYIREDDSLAAAMSLIGMRINYN